MKGKKEYKTKFNEKSPDWSFLLEIFRFKDEDDYEYENWLDMDQPRSQGSLLPALRSERERAESIPFVYLPLKNGSI